MSEQSEFEVWLKAVAAKVDAHFIRLQAASDIRPPPKRSAIQQPRAARPSPPVVSEVVTTNEIIVVSDPPAVWVNDRFTHEKRRTV
jgi:hypothetical protein